MIIWTQKAPYVYSGVLHVLKDTDLIMDLMALTGTGWELKASVGSRTFYKQFTADFTPDAKKQAIKEILNSDMLDGFEDAKSVLEMESNQEGITYGL